MRHVPEDELHAYLDQALSRSQAVEIEIHLAACGRCRDARDSIAGLRDHTTALLNRLTPRPLIVPPPFQTLVERHQARPAPVPAGRTLRRAGLWAAALIAAIGLGWAGRSALENGPTENPAALAAVTPAPAPAPPPADVSETNLESVATPLPLPEHSIRYPSRPATFQPATLAPAPVVQLVSAVVSIRDLAAASAPAPTPDTHSPFDGIWRQVSWEEALKAVGSGLPFIEGMPVLGVLLQPGSGGERPTVIVTQQDPSGEIIQSIEGPAARMPELLQHQAGSDTHTSEIIRTPPDYVETASGYRRSLRAMSLVGRLPVDSLNILARLATLR